MTLVTAWALAGCVAPDGTSSTTERPVAPANTPQDFRDVCLAHAGDPAAQETAFSASPDFRPSGVTAFRSGSRYATYARSDGSFSGGLVVTDSPDGRDSCSVSRKDRVWTWRSDGTVTIQERETP